jgi:hypothetical protein
MSTGFGLERPAFMEGTFDWKRYGFRYAAEPTVDLLSADALRTDNAWLLLAAILERAKLGDFSGVKLLEGLYPILQPFPIGRIALYLSGDIANDRGLKQICRAMAHADPRVRRFACQAGVFAGRLWLVPFMLDAWSRASTGQDAELMGYAISDMLEPRPSSIALLAPFCPSAMAALGLDLQAAEDAPEDETLDDDDQVERFVDVVRARYAELVEELGSEKRTVWRGVIFDVGELARQIIRTVRNEEVNSLFDYIHKFEANTGLNCTGCFRDIKPDRLAIEALMEDFFESGHAAQFEPGARYFFGHRIQD